jgi:threonyl-tRNA synthetase
MSDWKEDVRLVIYNRDAAARAEDALRDAGIVAFADHRTEPEDVKIRDALTEGVPFVIVVSVLNWIPNQFRAEVGETDWLEKMKVKVFTAADQDVKVMTLRGAIKMINQRLTAQIR